MFIIPKKNKSTASEVFFIFSSFLMNLYLCYKLLGLLYRVADLNMWMHSWVPGSNQRTNDKRIISKRVLEITAA